MTDRTPQAVQSCHELLLWLIRQPLHALLYLLHPWSRPHLDKFPRTRRFTLGERLEGGLLAVLEHLVEAAYSRDKAVPSRIDNVYTQPRIAL